MIVELAQDEGNSLLFLPQVFYGSLLSLAVSLLDLTTAGARTLCLASSHWDFSNSKQGACNYCDGTAAAAVRPSLAQAPHSVNVSVAPRLSSWCKQGDSPWRRACSQMCADGGSVASTCGTSHEDWTKIVRVNDSGGFPKEAFRVRPVIGRSSCHNCKRLLRALPRVRWLLATPLLPAFLWMEPGQALVTVVLVCMCLDGSSRFVLGKKKL